jgi:hypothetical protein
MLASIGIPLWVVLLGLTLIYFMGICIHRLVFSPIAHFPGPKLAAVTFWYDLYYDVVQRGQYFRQIDKMHQQYGFRTPPLIMGSSTNLARPYRPRKPFRAAPARSGVLLNSIYWTNSQAAQVAMGSQNVRQQHVGLLNCRARSYRIRRDALNPLF